MIKNALYLYALLMSVLLMGCAGKTDEELSLMPAPLPKFEAKLSLKPLWKVSTDAEVEGVFTRLQPAMAYGKVFVAGSKGVVQSRDLKTGKLVWKSKIDGIIESGVAVAEQIVVVGTQEGEVIALDAETGKEKWRNLVSSEVIAPAAIGENNVIVRTIDGKLFAMDDKTGKRNWFFDRSVPSLTLRGTSTPIIARGAVVSGFDNGNVALFFLKNGKPIWEKRIAQSAGRSELDQIVDVDAKPLVVSDILYAVTYNGNIAAVNLRDGEYLWQREMSSFQNITSDGRDIYATTAEDAVTSISTQQGATNWTQSTLKNRHLSAPASVGNYIVVADFEGYLFWLSSSTGEFLQRMRVDSGGITGAPIAYLDYVITQSRDGHILAVKLDDDNR